MIRAADEVPAITGLRGLAALWVMVYHVWVEAVPRKMLVGLGNLSIDLTPFFSLGWAGVQVFFVLSGYLLAQPFIRFRYETDGAWIAGYAVRRLMRILPAYLFQAGVLVVIAISLSGGEWLKQQPAVWLLGQFTLNFFPPPLGVTPLNGVWWTLPIELSFYVALPFLMLAFRALGPWKFYVLMLVVMVVWRAWVVSSDIPVVAGNRLVYAYQLPGAMDCFAAGMLAAWIVKSATFSRFRSVRLPHVARHVLLVGLGVMLLYWMHFGYRQYWTMSPIFFLWTPALSAIIALLLIEVHQRNGALGSLLMVRPLHFVGVVSYGIYLWHMPVMNWMSSVPQAMGVDGYIFWPLLLLTTLITLILATVSWYLVERPAIRFGKWFGGKFLRESGVGPSGLRPDSMR